MIRPQDIVGSVRNGDDGVSGASDARDGDLIRRNGFCDVNARQRVFLPQQLGFGRLGCLRSERAGLAETRVGLVRRDNDVHLIRTRDQITVVRAVIVERRDARLVLDGVTETAAVGREPLVDREAQHLTSGKVLSGLGVEREDVEIGRAGDLHLLAGSDGGEQHERPGERRTQCAGGVERPVDRLRGTCAQFRSDGVGEIDRSLTADLSGTGGGGDGHRLHSLVFEIRLAQVEREGAPSTQLLELEVNLGSGLRSDGGRVVGNLDVVVSERIRRIFLVPRPDAVL